MLKLIKYDFMKIKTISMIFCIIGIVINALLYITYKIYRTSDVEFLKSIVLILAILAVIFLFSLPVFVIIISIMLYSSDISKKSGYMTFLTPNSAYKIIGSKIILCLIIMICAVFIEMAFIIADLKMFLLTNNSDFSIIKMAEVIFKALEKEKTSIVIAIIAFIIEWITIILSFYLAESISYSIARKGKLNFIIAAGIWIGVTIIESVASSIIGLKTTAFSLTFGTSGNDIVAYANLPIEQFILSIVFYAILGSIYYIITSYLTEKKISM